MTHGGKRESLAQERFDRLLAFLNCNHNEEGTTPAQLREERGLRYEELRRKQIRLFAWRGSPTPELLADRTFDRVMAKLDTLEWNKGDDPALYVLRVGRYIFQESLREAPRVAVPPPAERSEADDRDLECLDECMEKMLEPQERELILEYYRGDKRAKIDHRREVAGQHHLSLNALRIECCRIRRRLRECLQNCAERK